MPDTVIARLFRDERGYPNADVPPPWHFLGWFMMNDLQGDLNTTRRTRSHVDDYRSGRATEVWDGTGNAWTLTLTPGSAAELELEAIEDDVELHGTVPLAVLDQLLAGWERMLETGAEQLVEFDAYDPGPHTRPPSNPSQ